MLEPGESFGWESYAVQEAIDGGAPPSVAGAGGLSREGFPTKEEDAANINTGISPSSGTPRLARIGRLHSGGSFVSGSTSLLSLVDG